MLRPPEYVLLLEELGIEDEFVAEFFGYATVREMYSTMAWKCLRVQGNFVHMVRLLQKAQDGRHALARVDMVRDVIPPVTEATHIPAPAPAGVVRGLKNLSNGKG